MRQRGGYGGQILAAGDMIEEEQHQQQSGGHHHLQHPTAGEGGGGGGGSSFPTYKLDQAGIFLPFKKENGIIFHEEISTVEFGN